jgi:hypothetical protein
MAGMHASSTRTAPSWLDAPLRTTAQNPWASPRRTHVAVEPQPPELLALLRWRFGGGGSAAARAVVDCAIGAPAAEAGAARADSAIGAMSGIVVSRSAWL